MTNKTGFFCITAAVSALFALIAVDRANAAVGNRPDPHDICPVPLCAAITPNKDDRYRNMQIHGPMIQVDNTKPVDSNEAPVNPAKPLDAGMQGAMSNAPGIANKDTPAISLVEHFPWLYLVLDGESQIPLYRNAEGGESVQRGSSQNAVSDEKRDAPKLGSVLAALGLINGDAEVLNSNKCRLIKDKCPYSPQQVSDGTDLDFGEWQGGKFNWHYPVWLRLAADSCTNQYIAPMGLNIDSAGRSYIFDDTYRAHLFPWNETVCQPLVLKPVDCERNAGECRNDPGERDGKMYDYRAWGYLRLAYDNVLNRDYFPTGGVSQDTEGTNPVRNTGANLIGKPELMSNDPSKIIQASQKWVNSAKQYGDPFNPAMPGGNNYAASDTPIGVLTTINNLADRPFERIWDPTHPFSPRWDWKGTDRDYSEKANFSGTNDPKVLSNFVQGIDYIITPNVVPAQIFASDDDLPGYDLNDGGTCTVRCGAVPVDILTFRKEGFDKCMTCRINANKKCFWSEVANMQVPLIPIPTGGFKYRGISRTEAITHTLSNTRPVAGIPWPLWGSTKYACKTTYDQNNQWPVCSTKYDFAKDNVPGHCSQCVALSGDTDANGGVRKCCDNLAKALAGINTLKIRNTRQNPALEPVPEGYRFSDYFTAPSQSKLVGGVQQPAIPARVVHMPYMRWWDTGTAAGGTTDAAMNNNPNCDLGSYDVLVGVGTDGNKGANGAKYCRLGGNGNATNYSCYDLPHNVDALTSWQELKQYQARAMRDLSLFCLPQYEKMYKMTSMEDGALYSAGGTYPRVEQNPKDGQIRTLVKPFPIPWRGYLSDNAPNDRFPNFNGGAAEGQTLVGLDNAKTGDIIYMTYDDVAPATPGVQLNPFIAVVFDTNLAGKCDDHIEVYMINNGKIPDVCGNTDEYGRGQPRKIYKSHLPADVYEKLYQAGEQAMICDPQANNETNYTVTVGITGLDDGAGLGFSADGDCKDPKMGVCMFDADVTRPKTDIWNRVRIYRPNR